MSQRLTIELPDEMYVALARVARDAAQSPQEWLLQHLPELLPATLEPGTHNNEHSLWTAEEEAWFAAEAAAFEAEWQQHLVEMETLRHQVPASPEAAHTEVERILADMAGSRLAEADAIELAMSEDIAEWNLDLD